MFNDCKRLYPGNWRREGPLQSSTGVFAVARKLLVINTDDLPRKLAAEGTFQSSTGVFAVARKPAVLNTRDLPVDYWNEPSLAPVVHGGVCWR